VGRGGRGSVLVLGTCVLAAAGRRGAGGFRPRFRPAVVGAAEPSRGGGRGGCSWRGVATVGRVLCRRRRPVVFRRVGGQTIHRSGRRGVPRDRRRLAHDLRRCGGLPIGHRGAPRAFPRLGAVGPRGGDNFRAVGRCGSPAILRRSAVADRTPVRRSAGSRRGQRSQPPRTRRHLVLARSHRGCGASAYRGPLAVPHPPATAGRRRRPVCDCARRHRGGGPARHDPARSLSAGLPQGDGGAGDRSAESSCRRRRRASRTAGVESRARCRDCRRGEGMVSRASASAGGRRALVRRRRRRQPGDGAGGKPAGLRDWARDRGSRGHPVPQPLGRGGTVVFQRYRSDGPGPVVGLGVGNPGLADAGFRRRGRVSFRGQRLYGYCRGAWRTRLSLGVGGGLRRRVLEPPPDAPCLRFFDQSLRR